LVLLKAWAGDLQSKIKETQNEHADVYLQVESGINNVFDVMKGTSDALGNPVESEEEIREKIYREMHNFGVLEEPKDTEKFDDFDSAFEQLQRADLNKLKSTLAYLKYMADNAIEDRQIRQEFWDDAHRESEEKEKQRIEKEA